MHKSETVRRAESLLTIKETAERLSASRQALHTWAQRGALVPIHVGRCVRYRESDIERVMTGGLATK